MAPQKELIVSVIAVLLTASALFSMAPEVPEALKENLTKDNLKCTARSTMIARGQSWVDKHVPYNQQGSYDGYRTDCSGFVSMCWELAKPGLTTFTMHTVATNIGKDALQAGDAMNCDSRHIVLFAGWADGGKTQYVAMEEANSSTGTIKRNIPYPYFGGDTCFHPIRYNNVC